jgi:ER membrane protein complex subunit 1
MLVQYEPVLPDNGQLVLSHYYEVRGILSLLQGADLVDGLEQMADVRQIITPPSLLESTTLVLAVGTDLFLTRVATSGTFDAEEIEGAMRSLRGAS